jgi:hypothetical protein
MTNDFVAAMAGDALGSVAPVDDFLLHVDDAEAYGQAVEDAAADLRVVKCGHVEFEGRSLTIGLIGRIHRDFRGGLAGLWGRWSEGPVFQGDRKRRSKSGHGTEVP